MKKIYVLDTNVLLHDVQAMEAFEDNEIIVPIVVIEELDNFKTHSDERGKNARIVSRALDSYREKGRLSEGVPTNSGGTLRIEMERANVLPTGFVFNKSDNGILNIAYSLKLKEETRKTNKKPVIIVTKDTNLRLKSEALGIEAQDFITDKINFSELYTGVAEVETDASVIDALYKNKTVPLPAAGTYYPNQFIIFKSNDGSKKSAIGRVGNNGEPNVKLLSQTEPVAWGIKPLNKEQRFAMELLLDDSLDIVTLVGAAGTGKTLITLATGLQRTLDEEKYRRLVVCRSIVPVGKDIGFLPGTKEEKLEVWMGAIYDNMAFLADRRNPDEGEEKAKYILDSGKVEIASITHIRGRSLPQQYMIVDDAQNLTPHEMKTILTRAGEGTKVVVTGDPYQIDTPYLDAESNGLTYLVDRFKGQKNHGHVTFTKTERSRLADLASHLL
ncbi:phosphate starvation-inducible protein-like putative ATPase [Elusimicrobium minutum Pei191]|uniref:Phosphate starvation-inducible protein-like putative ATPase n=1 Tax=Elusimicrobium minutum (strain Pei191) TaxID=445932 RepID=B2KAP4_ELUMP|nr:PhoH family protein [Elusimicrobium minutum]ACC97590.1 phosphate starvation-inducible protein-like putative ATPase [Elusimicrobium minutum Pei191]